MRNVIAAIVVLVIVIGGGALILHNRKSSNSAPTNTPAATSSMANNSTSNSNNTAQSTNEVTITNFAFSPSKITVKKGTTVVWTNKDNTQHTVTSDSGSELKSDALVKGATYSHTFNTAGTFSYHCSFHSDMTGSVEVTE